MPKKSNAWRKPKKTEACVTILENILRIDWTVEEACTQAWINPKTYYERLKTDPIFSKKMSVAQNEPFIMSRHSLMLWAKTDPKMAIEFLKRRDKRYSDKQEHSWEWWWPIGVIFLPKLWDGGTDRKAITSSKTIWSSV